MKQVGAIQCDTQKFKQGIISIANCLNFYGNYYTQNDNNLLFIQLNVLDEQARTLAIKIVQNKRNEQYSTKRDAIK